MKKDRFGTKYDRLYVAMVTPFKADYSVDEAALRKILRSFMQPKFVSAGGGVVINPEAGEIFFLSREEKRRNVEIAMEECGGKVPVFAGALDLRTEDLVTVAKDAKKAGADGLFLMPPMGGMDITTCWDATKYPEVFIDFAKAAVDATDLPAIVHASSGPDPFYGGGIPLPTVLKMCKEIPNIVGWKMIASYLGTRVIARALREDMDRHVGILCAAASWFHENLANGYFDGTVSGFWNYAMDPMLEHINAWRADDVVRARKVWHAGLMQLHDYVAADSSRLHIRYKIATWLRGLIPLPIMRPPMPPIRKIEVSTLYELLQKCGLDVISKKEVDKYAGTLTQ
jgi:4-hydroxy-tetrahydrodipicolinate synthase